MRKRRWLSLTLSAVMALSMAVPASAAPVEVPVAEEQTTNALSLENVVSIQAYTAGTYYGTGLTQVEITYKDGVDVSAAAPADYVLTDRGTLNPDYGELNISDVTVDGQVVTLNISDLTDATENNKMVYTGDDKEGSRERNAFGVYCTGAWYRDAEGTIYYGSDDTDEYENNTTGRGYQARETLELKLQVVGEDAVESLANDLGQYNAEGKWLETIDTQFGEGAFQSLTDLQIASTAADADWSEIEQADAEPYVRGYYYVPENYDPANGIVFTLQGQGISYWNLKDGSNNDGTGIMYDCATASWANKGAIVVNIHDRSSQQSLAEGYDFVVDDVNVMKYFIEKYNITGNIVLQGNSRGTMASDIVIKALAGCAYNPGEQAMGATCDLTYSLDKSVYDFEIDTYICQNGTMGGSYWTDDVIAAIAATGLKVWAFDGEQDSNNIDNIANYKAAAAAAGYSDEWIAENVRLTGLTSNLTYYWGESDHSATRTNGWYFANAAYYGPDLHIDEATGEIVYDTKLNDGDTYTLECRGSAASSNKVGYEYTVYDDLFQVWAFEAAGAPETPEEPEEPESEIPSLDDMEVPETDKTQANQLPMTGYFQKTILENRTVKVYLSEGIHVRDYYTFIAVPDGVDTEEFLTEQGWFAMADERNEGLFILEPGEGGWGTAEEEAEYIKAAISFYGGNSYFSVFGEHYFVGYGAGAPVLEAWAAANPLKVIAQTYVDSEGLSAEYLAEQGAVECATSAPGYCTISYPEGFEYLTNADVVVPTYFVGSAPEASLNYWNAVNDTVAATEDAVFGTVYAQDPESDSWTTDFSGPISKVAVAESADTANICEFMYYYSRYENALVYGNQLTVRETYENAEFYTVTVNGYPREYYVYTPDSAAETDVPVVVVWPGNTQTDRVFTDATSWMKTADENGFIVVMMCEDYNTSTTVTHKNSQAFYEKMLKKLKKDYAGVIDEGRIYGTGQSLGSMTTQGQVATHPEDYAAVASTSGPLMSGAGSYGEDENTYASIPTYMIYGAGDLTMLEGNVWDDIDNSLDTWLEYVLEANGLDFEAVGEDDYTVTALDSFGHKELHKWTWTKNFEGVDVPMVQLAQNNRRAHNCIVNEMPDLWDYLKHFSVVYDKYGNVAARYYSASAFEEDDAVAIYEATNLQNEVVDIQATIAPNFYGYKVSQVVITFAQDVDAEELAAANIAVYDRGSANPNFGALNVVDTKIEGNVVTLTINTDSDKLTDRSRNTYGNLTCTGWYMDSEGNIYCAAAAGTMDAFGNEIYANAAGKTCQPRNLDLILCVNSMLTKGIKSTDTLGNWTEGTVWEEPVKTGGLELIEQEFVNVGWYAADYDQVSDNGEVPVQVIWPENYDPDRAEAYPIIDYQCGGGVCYWQISKDESKGIYADANNLGDNTVYDNMMTIWHEMYPDAIIMSVNVHSSNTENAAAEINAAIEYANENWNAAEGKAIIVGNSQGTIIGSDAIRQAPELWAGYVECNGNFGSMGNLTAADGTKENSSFSAWSDEDFANMIANPVAVWMNNGETDGTNAGVAQDTYAVLKDAYMAAGYSEDWVYNNIRLSGYQSWKFKEWGETDHSVTKIVAWNYIARPYTDVYVNATLKAGDHYKFTGAEDYAYYDYTMDFDYTVYAESISEWAHNLLAGDYAEVPAPAKKQGQNIVTANNKKLIKVAYGDAAFNLGARATGNGALTYKSSDTKVVKVDKNGKVTIKGTGVAKITINAAETETRAAKTISIKVQVAPKKAKVASAKAGKQSVAVTVKKDSKATGYQIQVSTSVNFTKKTTTTKTLKKNTSLSATIKNLKSGKTYYVRTRSYKTVDGSKIYGAYSAVKTVKVK